MLVLARARARAALEGEGHALRGNPRPGPGCPARCPGSGAESARSGGPRLSGAGRAPAPVSPAAGRTGRFAQGASSPGTRVRAAQPFGCRALCGRGAGSPRPISGAVPAAAPTGLSRVRSPPALQPLPSSTCGAAPARPAQPRRRSIPRALRLPPPPPPPPGAGGREGGGWAAGGWAVALGRRPPRPAPPPGLLRNLVAPRDSAPSQGVGPRRGVQCPRAPPRGRHPPPGLPPPLETRHGTPPAPCPLRGLSQRQSKHSACGTEGDLGATFSLQLQERGPRRGSDLPKDIHSALSPKSAESAMGTAVCPQKLPFILVGPLQGFGSGHPHHETDPTPAAGVLGSSVGKMGWGLPIRKR